MATKRQDILDYWKTVFNASSVIGTTGEAVLKYPSIKNIIKWPTIGLIPVEEEIEDLIGEQQRGIFSIAIFIFIKSLPDNLITDMEDLIGKIKTAYANHRAMQADSVLSLSAIATNEGTTLDRFLTLGIDPELSMISVESRITAYFYYASTSP